MLAASTWPPDSAIMHRIHMLHAGKCCMVAVFIWSGAEPLSAPACCTWSVQPADVSCIIYSTTCWWNLLLRCQASIGPLHACVLQACWMPHPVRCTLPLSTCVCMLQRCSLAVLIAQVLSMLVVAAAIFTHAQQPSCLQEPSPHYDIAAAHCTYPLQPPCLQVPSVLLLLHLVPAHCSLPVRRCLAESCPLLNAPPAHCSCSFCRR